jgi:ribonuclease HII
MKHAHVGVGIANVEEIDAMNILQASLLSMTRALENLSLAPVAALIDGIHAPITQIPCETIIKGDSVSFSIAAASIIAKVTRDRMMQALHQEFPHYAWDSNAGYGTKAHKEGLAAHGITPHHRRSFKPVAELA